MHECWENSAVGMVFLLIAVFRDRTAGYSEGPKHKQIHTNHLDSINYLFKPCGVVGLKVSNYNLKEDTQKLKAVANEIFDRLEERNLSKLKFCMLYNVVVHESRIELLNYHDASVYEHINFVI